jgi:hypothetical protein
MLAPGWAFIDVIDGQVFELNVALPGNAFANATK